MITPEQIREQAKIDLSYDSFWEYCKYHDPEFFGDRPFLKQVAKALQWVYEEYIQGHARSITISMPPRTGKSYIISLFSAWWLGKLPALGIMRNAATNKLYEKFSYDTRKIVASGKYRAVFPHVQLSGDRQNVKGWNLQTSKQVAYFGGGTGGTIIGFGANIAIYDDLYTGIFDASNDNVNEATLLWKVSDHNTRKELNCPEIGIGTRWRKNDVIGNEIEKGNVDKIFKIAALVYDEVTKSWKSFCEKVNTTEFYLKEKRDSIDAWFDAMYMQEPMDLKGMLFPTSKLRLYNPNEFDPQKASEMTLGAIDPADKGGDSLCGIVGHLVGKDIYVSDVICNTDGTDINEGRIFHFITTNKILTTRFESNSAWIVLGKKIRAKLHEADSDCSLNMRANMRNKHTRILAEGAFIMNHFIFRSDWQEIPEYRAFIKMMGSYMKDTGATHDDAPDNAAELAKFFQEQLPHVWG